MSKLAFLEEKTPDQIINEKLNSWLHNPPDYYTVAGIYDTLSNLKKRARIVKGEIAAIERSITAESDKPKSNDVRKKQIVATEELHAELTDLEANIEYFDAQAKKVEYMRSMFASSTFALKSRLEIA